MLRTLSYSLTLWIVLVAPLAANEQAILEIIVNGQNIGQQFVQLTPSTDVWVSAEVLKALRLRETLWAGQTLPVALSRLRPHLEFTLDEQASTLVLAVPLEWFIPQNISRKQATPPPPPLSPQPRSAFLNYQIQATWQEHSQVGDVMLPWEMGINAGQWFASSTFTTRYLQDRDSTETLRQFSSLTWDNPQTLQTLIIGDFNAPYTLLGSSGNYGGISWRKNFRLDNQFKYWPNLDLRTQVRTPSHAEIYSNGHRVEEWEVLPGEVVFDNLGAYAGGDAELVLTDAFGHQTRINVPTMMSQQLLKPGLHEYSYNLGWPRENMGSKSAAYGTPALLGFHRYGFTDRLTAGFSLALDQQRVNAGPSGIALLGNHSQVEAGTLLSYADNIGHGYAAALRYSYSYSYNYKAFNFFTGLEGFSQDYTNFGTTVTQETLDRTQQTRYRGSLNLNYNTPTLGGFSVNYSEQQRWDDATTRQVNLGYRKQFSFGILLGLGARRNLDDSSQNEVFLDLIYYPKQENHSRFYDNLSYRLSPQEEKGRSQNFSVQKSFPRGPGYGYTVDVKEEDSNLAANGRLQYQNDNGTYTTAVNRNPDTSYSGNISVAGGLVWIDGGIYAGRPITDSFALVRVTGLDNVLVQHQNSQIGSASENHPLLVSELSSYSQNYLSINPQKLPLNYALNQASKYVAVGQRSGSVIDFKFTRFMAVEGNLYGQAADGKRLELEALPLEFQVGTDKRESFLGRKGYFYLENLPVGEYTVRVLRFGGDCLTHLTVLDGEKIVTNLGELACIPTTENK